MLVEKARFPVTFMCARLEVSRSGFYAWTHRPKSARQESNRLLVVQIHEVFEASDASYGSPRVQRELRRQGLRPCRHRIARLMQRERLVARPPPRRFVHTTNSAHEFAVAPNLLKREFAVEAPNKVWVADITYVPTAQGWLYLAVVIDLFSRRVVGWAASARIDAHLALTALERAFESRRPPVGLLHHSDRGVQYACYDYRRLLAANGAVASMSRKGNCWDNAVAESFFSSLKMELVHRRSFAHREQASTALFKYIEAFYNSRRLHSTLDYQSPQSFEDGLAA